MRNDGRWEKKHFPKILSKLTPRIAKAVLRIIDEDHYPDNCEVKSMFIFGEKGVGKTIHAVFLYLTEMKRIYLEDRSDKCLFISAPDIFYSIRQSYAGTEGFKTEAEIIDELRNVHLLVLDDIGAHKNSDFVLQTLYLIINYRYEYNKPTIFTSNLDLDGLAELMGDQRITSRIERMCEIVKKKDWKTKK